MTDFVEPAYGDRSLGDVFPAVARALGRPIDADAASDAGSVWELPPAPAYVVFLVDGLGTMQLAAHADEAPYLHGLTTGSAQGTAGVPSTTATSLTSLGTALPPGAHGVVGFSSRIPGTNELLYALAWSKHVDPQQWQPHPTVFSRMTAAGLGVTTVNKREFRGSGLTEASARGAEFVGADRLGERLVAVQSALRSATPAEPAVAYMYEGDLDWTGHRYGVDSPQWRAQLAMIDMAAQRFREELPDEVRMVVVADHGMVDATEQVDIDHVDGMRDGIGLIGGEARLRYLYCVNGAVDDVAARWRAELGDRADVLTRDEAIARGWFGDVSTTVRPRLGDVVVAARGRTLMVSTQDNPYEARLIGMHGSLTPDEMLIPVLLA